MASPTIVLRKNGKAFTKQFIRPEIVWGYICPTAQTPKFEITKNIAEEVIVVNAILEKVLFLCKK